jgi:hypothetical protein
MAIRQNLDNESREKLAEMIRTLPEREVRERLGGLASETLARAIAGMALQRGTIALIHASLAVHDGKAA